MEENRDCCEFDRKEYTGLVDLESVTEEGMYTIETGFVPVMDYHSFQESGYERDNGYIMTDSMSEDINGFDLLSELGLEERLILRDDEDRLYAKDKKTGETIEIASPFYRPEKTVEKNGQTFYRTTIVREFVPIADELEGPDFDSFRNTVFGGYRDNPYQNGHQVEHNDEDNNR